MYMFKHHDLYVQVLNLSGTIIRISPGASVTLVHLCFVSWEACSSFIQYFGLSTLYLRVGQPLPTYIEVTTRAQLVIMTGEFCVKEIVRGYHTESNCCSHPSRHLHKWCGIRICIVHVVKFLKSKFSRLKFLGS